LIIMFFKKGLRDSSLIRKLTMENPRMSEYMFSITNKYALAEEATLYTRRESRTVLSMRLNDPIIIRSTGPGQVNL
jgi:hypothetical protein